MTEAVKGLIQATEWLAYICLAINILSYCIGKKDFQIALLLWIKSLEKRSL